MEFKTREKARSIKDLEDDFVDLKQITLGLMYYILDLHTNVLSEEHISNIRLGTFFDFLATQILPETVKLRVDVEPDYPSKIMKILQEEIFFAQIVKENYLDKKVSES